MESSCEVIVLYEGFSNKIDDSTCEANCTCTLIKTPHANVIVDTMTAWDKQKIIEALAENNVQPENINYVVCSHSHADHIGNNNLFTEADKHIIGTTVHKSTLFQNEFISMDGYELCDQIQVIATPGHTADDVTVVVNGKFNGEKAIVAITGDLFEKKEDITNPSIWMNLGIPGLREVQASSRYKVAAIANVIIPGHGPPFYITNNMKVQLVQQLNGTKINHSDISIS